MKPNNEGMINGLQQISVEEQKRKKEVEEFVHSKVSGRKFLDYMIMINELTEEKANMPYSHAIYNKCRYFVTWCLVHLTGPNRTLQKEFSIHEGNINGHHHVWLEYKGFYIDGTLAQFYPEKEGILVISKDEANPLHYYSQATYSLIAWIEKEENSEF